MLRGAGVHEAGASGLGLGDLFARACETLSVPPPPDELLGALNSDQPRQALEIFIAAGTQQPSSAAATSTAVATSTAAVPDARNLLAQDSCTPDQLARIIAQLTLSGRNPDALQAKLTQELANLEQRASQRQDCRRQGLSALSSVALQQLSDPGRSLSPSSSRDCLVSCMAHGREAAARAAGTRMVAVLGNTGAGKSALVNLLHGCTFALGAEDHVIVAPDSPVPELMRIGHTNQSQTFVPQVEPAPAASLGARAAFADCPGFIDSRGFEINVSNAVNVRQAVAAAASCVVVVVINYFSLLADRGKGVRDLMAILASLFGTPAAVRAHASSVLLAISQAPARHPESGAAFTLQQHARRLLDPTGLDESSRQTLKALGGGVCVYHLLGRGDSSWLDRAALLGRIAALKPIEAPAALFRSAIAEHDKESLRGLVAQLADTARTCVVAGRYAAAADEVADLLEVKMHARSEFISAIVDEAIAEAVVTERIATIRAAVDRCMDAPGGKGEHGHDHDDPAGAEGVQGADGDVAPMDITPGNQGEEGLADGDALAERLEAARAELRELGSAVAAFAGIPQVREPLVALLARAMLDLETVARRAAEAEGRRAVEEPMRELLRAVGENVVKEVLALPAAATAMREARQLERSRLEAAHADELRRLRSEPLGLQHEPSGVGGAVSGDLVGATRERHMAELLEADLRAEGADGAWAAHIEHAAAKLTRRDAALLAAEGAAFWERVGGPSGAASGGDSGGGGDSAMPTTVDWARRRLVDGHCEVIGAVLRSGIDSSHLVGLFLSGNQIGDEGVGALMDATAFGALPNLQRLFLDNNRFGDLGAADLADALVARRLAALTFLDLNRNMIADKGMCALAEAVAAGALERLSTLYLNTNAIGDAGALGWVQASTPHGHIALPLLSKLYLGENCIGEVGLAALRRAQADGTMPALTVLQLDGNTTNAVRWARLE